MDQSEAPSLSLPTVTLPKGGGAIRGIGEKFSVNPARGTFSLQVPVYVSPGRSGFGPQLSLGYDSGAGNSAFGLGWSLPVPAIARKTDKGLPRYTGTDTFVISGAEDLVPVDEAVPDEIIDGVVYSVLRYRPRVEAAFSRIERLRAVVSGDIFWRSVSRENMISVFGRTARVADPAEEGRVFQWLLEQTRDDRGNVSLYEYVNDGAQRYLSSIRYCEHLLVRFEYEDRPDPFSSHRSGFAVRTSKRCRRIAMYHDFPAEFAADGGPNPRLVRSTDLSYDDDPAGVHLLAVTQSGHIWDNGAYRTQSLPPVKFEYTVSSPGDTVHRVAAQNLPQGVDSQRYQWVDLDGEGISGALTHQGGAWFYKRNLGAGKLGALERLPAQPALTGDGQSLSLVDIAGDGSRALVRHGPALHGFQERTAEGQWAPFRAFRDNPGIAWGDPALRQVDLDGDGLTDLLITDGHEFRWHPGLGRDGYGEEHRTFVAEDGPLLLRSSTTETVLLADMSGDGLADLVRVGNGGVWYWPNLGYGRFGAKVTMTGAPLFDDADQFDPARLRVADIDGSGTTDLLYLGRGEVRFWINRCGNGFGPPIALRAVPDTDRLETIEVVDLLGTGTSCLVWSLPLPSDRDSPLRYVDLCQVKGNLLHRVDNNCGSEARVAYTTSTQQYLLDRAAGAPWRTRLHFPVQVVAQVSSFDQVAKTQLSTSYRYRHGYFDAAEREFRGFGMVEQTDAETFPLFDEAGSTELHRPPVRTRSWFHLGAEVDLSAEYFTADAPLGASVLDDGLSAVEHREALRALAGQPLRTEVYADDASPNAAVPYTVTEHRYRVHLLQPKGSTHAVFRHHALETVNYHYERDIEDPRIGHEVVLETDAYNTVIKSITMGYPRRVPQIPEQAKRSALLTVQEVAHVDTAGVRRLAVPVETRKYEVELPASAGPRYTVAEAGQTAPQRLIEHTRLRYWDDAQAVPLPAGAVGRRALIHQTYRLAFTQQLLTDIYAGRVTPAMLAEGGYHGADGAWWIPSGVQHFDPMGFYLPVKQVSPFGNESSVAYDTYKLLPAVSRQSSLAPLDKLVTTARNDYRTLAPVEVTEPNGNRVRAAFDALGRVSATWAMGKEGSSDGDPQGLPGAEFVYAASSWFEGNGPVWAQSRTRERHGDAASPWQVAKAYSDGTGRVVMTKQQAQPDEANLPRWIGSGRTVFDNKGKPVKQFEPYYSLTDAFEDEPDIVEQGVTPILHYDPIGRLVRTEYPDGTLSRVVIGPWQQESWDPNDTVKDSLWYAERGAPDPGSEPEPNDPNRRAAWLAAQHAATPALSRMDSLGQAVRAIADGGPLGLLETVSELDIQGNVRSVTDPRAIVVQAQKFDLTGRAGHTLSPDSGQRWTLMDIAGTPIRGWDGINIFHYQFDALRRPVRTLVAPEVNPTAWRVVSAVWHGEGHPSALARNLLGRAAVTLDGAGLAVVVEHDFKGNPRATRRRLLADPGAVVDWSGLEATPVNDVEGLVSAKLETQVHQSASDFDALNRPTTSVAPDGTITTLAYNEAGRLDTVRVNPIGPLDENFYVREIGYDAKGQRQFIVYGNFVRTKYTYDKHTYRLARLETFRSNALGQPLQDLRYTYDPSGNVVEIRDSAQQAHFYQGQLTTPGSRYSYDALYRLASASGREHDSLGSPHDHGDPAFGKPIPHPNDAAKLRPYTQTYSYDRSGNLTKMQHQAGAGSWTRTNSYATTSNRLLDGTGYDAHGSMTSMAHLSALTWDHADRLETVNLGGGGTARYGYDSAGQRARKTLQRNGGLIEERVYLGGYEIHRRLLNGAVTFQRTTVHVMDDAQRLAMIEHDTLEGDVRVRYQLGNHLGSCTLEVDNSLAAQVISYEEYHPFGTTALWLGSGDVEVIDRRYRYTGKEKDEETGLYYYGARYYAPWLARWTAADPIGIKDSTNVYLFVRNDPIQYTDPDGREPTPNQKRWVEIFKEQKTGPSTSPGGFDNNHAQTLIKAFTDTKIQDPKATVASRFLSILDLTSNKGRKTDDAAGMPTPHFQKDTITDLQEGTGDTGFRDELRDSVIHPSSANQIGHFLTAADMGYEVQMRRNLISKQVEMEKSMPKWTLLLTDVVGSRGSARLERTVGAEGRLFERGMVGHELIADGDSGSISNFGWTDAAAVRASSWQDVDNFKKGRLDLIKIDTSKKGNSYQDLLLTWVGYRFGQHIANQKFASNAEAARWLTMMLTDVDLSKIADTDPFKKDAQEMQALLVQIRQIEANCGCTKMPAKTP